MIKTTKTEKICFLLYCIISLFVIILFLTLRVADISLIGRNDHQRTDEVYICGDGLLTTEGDGAIVLLFLKK